MRPLFPAVQHERGPRTSTIRKQVALYFRGHKEENGATPHFPSAALPAPAFFTAVTQLEPHNLELAAVSTTPDRQALVGLAQPTPKVSCLPGSTQGHRPSGQRVWQDIRTWNHGLERLVLDRAGFVNCLQRVCWRELQSHLWEQTNPDPILGSVNAPVDFNENFV